MPDDTQVSVTFEACRTGELLCGADKTALKEFLRGSIEEHRERREGYL